MYPRKAIFKDRSSLECLTKGGLKWTPHSITKGFKGMCINIRYSMSIIEKVFKYGETELSVIKCKDDIWFRGKTLAEVLGYSNPLKAICTHIDSEDKREMSELVYKGGAQNEHPFRKIQQGTIYVNESGLYLLLSFVPS